MPSTNKQKVKLNADQTSLLANSLRVAALHYTEDAATFTSPSDFKAWAGVREQFQRQAKDAAALADQIDQAEAVVLELEG